MDRRPMAPVLNILLTLLHRLLLLLLFGSEDPSSLMGESGENILVVEFNGCECVLDRWFAVTASRVTCGMSLTLKMNRRLSSLSCASRK